MNCKLKRLTLISCTMILLFSCTLPNTAPHDQAPEETPTATTALLRITNNTENGWVLRLGDWSDDLTARTVTSETTPLSFGGTFDFKTLMPDEYSLWIRKGGSDYRLKFSDNNVLFSFTAGFECELTVITKDMSWTLTDGDSVVLGTGSVVEYPDVLVVNPASLHLTSNKTNFLTCLAGSWTNQIIGRITDSSSDSFSSYGSTDMKLAEGSYNLWIENGQYFYPLMKDESPYAFTLSSNGNYALAFTDLNSWALTNRSDGAPIASGVLSSVGYTKNLPVLSSLYPSDGSTNVYSNKKIYWYCNYADSYDLYFDSVDGSSLVAEGLTNKEYSPVLACSTTYYWKVVAKNAGGQSESAIQSFTTEPPLVATLRSDDDGITNQRTITVNFDFSIAIDKTSFIQNDLVLTGGATIDNFGQNSTSGIFYVRLIMPENDASVSLSLPAGVVKDANSRRSNTAASVSFDYHHIPMGKINTLKFENDSSGLWALDYTKGQLLYVDPASAVALYAWDLPYAYPADMDLIGGKLFIVYKEVAQVSIFSIDGNSPKNSFLEAGTYALPLRSGKTFVDTFDIAVDGAGNRLFIAYKDSDWPNDNVVCVLSAVNGSVITAPVVVGGNATSGCFMDYKAGKLAVAELGISNGDFAVYDTAGGLSLSSVTSDEMENSLSRDGYDMNASGSRVAVHCANTNIVATAVNNNYVIYDLAIDSNAFSYKGRWEMGAYCVNPQFSPDSDYLYIQSRDNNKLMVWDSVTYSKIRDIEFPNSSNYGIYRVSPDGNYIVGFSNNSSNGYYKFYHFDNVRD